MSSDTYDDAQNDGLGGPNADLTEGRTFSRDSYSDEAKSGETPDLSKVGTRTFPCRNCGGPLVFTPGTTQIKCPYCGTINEIPIDQDASDYLKENDYLEALEKEESHQTAQGDGPVAEAVRCTNCGAETTISPEITSDNCPYCGTPLAMQNHFAFKLNVQAVLPFAIDSDKAITIYRQWVGSRWFAPNDFKRRATREETMKGVYMPYWTYDTQTVTYYTGQRGDAYYTTQRVMVNQNGKMVPQMRQVRQIRWTPASGKVAVGFDDVLVPASNSLPIYLADALEPWQLDNLKPFRNEFLSGFTTETYKFSLKQGFEDAKQRMAPSIRQAVASHIGGDEQRISSMKSQYDKITFKHILLPVWISAYAYGGRTFRFTVNAQTGEASGDRPWSVWKIAAAVAAGLAALAGLFYLLNDSGAASGFY
ncbi:MAG: hypothetical protein LIP23_02915 [Planctomycetes bacterium]|nr:hypothetical protein [Planctomycetota bacterium]